MNNEGVNLEKKFDQWLDGGSSISLDTKQTEIISKFTVFGEGDSQISGQNSTATGPDAAKESQQSKEVDSAKKEGDLDKLAKLLYESKGNAVASILGLAQSRSGWNPLDPEKKNNFDGFREFVSQILRVPYFSIQQSEDSSVHYSEENYDKLIDDVAGLYDSITAADKEQIKKSVVKLAKACTSRVNTSNTDTLFVQNTMNASEDGDIIVGLEQSYMLMEYDSHSGKGAPKDKYKTDIEVKVVELLFKGSIWTPEAARKLAAKFVKSWDDWLDDTSTPETSDSGKIKFCFG
ncbi:hypothetical protein LWC08_03100 [Desulfobaculum bizertense]|uniref:hypothetical protein n=1 Tax=Desulfobaculum bizertense TaxID=376490 RepID=UPI001F28F521|nr:hypothetical protein [Desulfobaculum bizertense]UIJ38571.1 hypothetical protein LWC08_03100 [Desulfobaculum bizertense]